MKAILFLSSSAFLWGVNFHLLKIMLSHVGFLEAGFWRYLFGIGFLAIFTTKSFPSLQDLKMKISGVLLVGIAGLFFFSIFLFWGLKYTSSLNASLIISLNPIMTIILSYFFFRSPIRRIQIFGAGLGLLGIGYLLSRGSLDELGQVKFSTGDPLILLATILAACYHIWVKKYSAGISNQAFTFLTNATCLICFIGVLPFLPAPKPTAYPADFWIATLTFGSLGTALTYLLWNKGVKMVGASKAGLFMNLVPLSTALISVFIGEEITKIHILSGVLILSGLFLSQLQSTTLAHFNQTFKRPTS